jgi:hypothetical protein
VVWELGDAPAVLGGMADWLSLDKEEIGGW